MEQIYDSLASNNPDQPLEGSFLCRFCNFEVYNEEDLIDCKVSKAHAAAHRLAFEALQEQNTYPICPLCEEIIISDRSLSMKAGQVFFNDLDLVEHLEQFHFKDLLTEYINDFDKHPQLATTFFRMDLGKSKEAPLLHTSFINCHLCDWTSANFQLHTPNALIAEIIEHLAFHLEDDGFVIEDENEENVLKKAEIGALRFLPLNESVDLTSIPYAEKLAVLYPKQLAKIFGPTVAVVSRCLHGLQGNPFRKEKTLKKFDDRIMMKHQSKGGSCLKAQGLAGLAENLSADQIDMNGKTTRERLYPCGRDECDHEILDFGNSIKTISHILAHVRHEETQLCHAFEPLKSLICKCGVQTFSPMGYFYHRNNAHFFEEDDLGSKSVEMKIMTKAEMLVNSFAQTCFRGRQRPRHQIVVMELQARASKEEGSGEEKNWPLVQAPIDERWYMLWNRFVMGSLPANRVVELVCSSPFEDIKFFDGTASILYPETNPKKLFVKAHQYYHRFCTTARSVVSDDPEFVQYDMDTAELTFLKNHRRRLRRNQENRLRIAQRTNAIKAAFDISNWTKVQLANYLGVGNHYLMEKFNKETARSSDSESEDDLNEVSETNIDVRVEDSQPGSSKDAAFPSILQSIFEDTTRPLPYSRKRMVNLENRVVDCLEPTAGVYEEEMIDGELHDEQRFYCKTCANTSFTLHDDHSIKLHAAAHGVLLLRLNSCVDLHAEGVYSCPICPYDLNLIASAEDFDIASAIRHLMGRHGDVITQIYDDYLQKKYPQKMFTRFSLSSTESESTTDHGKMHFRCTRTSICKMPNLIATTSTARGFLSDHAGDLPVLKHLLFHIRTDKGLDLESQDIDLLTRCLMARMSNLKEKNMAIHMARVLSKYNTDSQMHALKFIIVQLKATLFSIFEEDAPWILRLVFPISNLRQHLPNVFLNAHCQKCSTDRLEKIKKQSPQFLIDPTSAMLHALGHQEESCSAVKFEPLTCPLCGEIFYGELKCASHFLTSHPICVNTGLLFPLMTSVSSGKKFSEALARSFGMQTWQIELAVGFPSHQPKHCPQLTPVVLTPGKTPLAIKRVGGVPTPMTAPKTRKIVTAIVIQKEPVTIAEALERLI